MRAGLNVGQYGPVLCTAKRFSSSTHDSKEGRTAVCQNKHSNSVTVALSASKHICQHYIISDHILSPHLLIQSHFEMLLNHPCVLIYAGQN